MTTLTRAGGAILLIGALVCGSSELAVTAEGHPTARWDQAAPPQDPGSARLGLLEARDTQLEVSVLRGSEACDDLRAIVQVLQDGRGKTESRACLDDKNRQARTELVIGQGPTQQAYKVLFEYMPKQRTVSYTIRRLSGTGIIESQRVVLDLSGRP